MHTYFWNLFSYVFYAYHPNSPTNKPGFIVFQNFPNFLTSNDEHFLHKLLKLNLLIHCSYRKIVFFTVVPTNCWCQLNIEHGLIFLWRNQRTWDDLLSANIWHYCHVSMNQDNIKETLSLWYRFLMVMTADLLYNF